MTNSAQTITKALSFVAHLESECGMSRDEAEAIMVDSYRFAPEDKENSELRDNFEAYGVAFPCEAGFIHCEACGVWINPESSPSEVRENEHTMPCCEHAHREATGKVDERDWVQK